MHDCFACQRCLATGEDRLVCWAGKKQKRVVLVGQVDEVQNEAGLLREGAWLPDLHPAEGADHDEARCGNASLVIGGLDPVAQRLLTMLRQALRLARRLHLDQADARPDQVEEAASLWLLEVRDICATRAIAGEELVEEGLRLGAFTAFVDAPMGGERGEPRTDLLAGRRHATRVRAGPWERGSTCS